MIDDLYQSGTDAVLADMVRRPSLKPPAAPAFSFGALAKSPFQGVGGGVAEGIAFGSELLGAFGDTLAATGTAGVGGMGAPLTATENAQAAAARKQIQEQGLSFSNDTGDLFRQRAAEIMPDAQTTHASAQIVASLTKFGTKAIGYSAMLGPVAPLAVAGDEGMTEADRLKALGVDEATRTKAGAAAGAIAGASLIPGMEGASPLIRFAKGAAVGEGAMVGQSLVEKQILDRAGYHQIADTFDPFDPVALGVGLVPGLLGARFGHAKVGEVKTEAQMKTAAAFTPDEQAHSDAFEASSGNLRELRAAIDAEKNPENKAALQAEYDRQSAAHEAALKDPQAQAAARVLQTRDALDSSRLTAADDLAGRDAHEQAVQTAADQIARGEDVNVAELLRDPTAEAFPEHAPLAGEDLTGMDHEAIAADAAEAAPAGATHQPTLATVKEAWGAAGIDHSVFEKDGVITLGKIALPKERRGQGLGTEAMQKLADYADSTRQRIVLSPATDFGASSKARLVKFYKSIGFVENKGRRKDFTISESMIREPQRNPRALAQAVDELRAARETAPQSASKTSEPAAQAAPRVAEPMAADHAGPAPSHASAAVDQVLQLHPDLEVMLEGMDKPMRVADLMAHVREQAAQEGKDARLIEVAAQCALSQL